MKKKLYYFLAVVAVLLLTPVCASEKGQIETSSRYGENTDAVDDTVGATTYTTGTQYFTKHPDSASDTFFERGIGYNDYACGYYSKDNKLELYILSWGSKPYYKMTQCYVVFKNSSGKTTSLTFKIDSKGWVNRNPDPYVLYYPKNNYKPYSANISYQKK